MCGMLQKHWQCSETLVNTPLKRRVSDMHCTDIGKGTHGRRRRTVPAITCKLHNMLDRALRNWHRTIISRKNLYSTFSNKPILS